MINPYSTHHHTKNLTEEIKSKKHNKFLLKNLLGSGRSFFISAIAQNLKNPMVIISGEKESAEYHYSDLINLLPEHQVLFFPSSFRRSSKYHRISEEQVVLRTKALTAVKEYNESGMIPNIIVTYADALSELIISQNSLKENTLEIRKGDMLSQEFVGEVLEEYQFELVDFVYEPGQYAIRGSLIDIFSFATETPYRIDFFGEEVESIRSFSSETQLSIQQMEKVTILPNLRNYNRNETKVTFFDYLSGNTLLWMQDSALILELIDQIYNETPTGMLEEKDSIISHEKENFITTGKVLGPKMLNFLCIELSSQPFFQPQSSYEFNTVHQPTFKKNFELLLTNLLDNQEKGYQTYILSENEKQFARLRSIFQDLKAEVNFTEINRILHEGFIDHDLKKCFYTDHQIFDRYHRSHIPTKFSNKEALTLREFSDLNPGDYVVHIDHGIGQFGGLETININDKKQEAIKLVYRDNDILYVSVHSLHKISKYKGKDTTPPKIYKLGTGAWQKIKQQTKRKVKDIARDLIKLYAKRKSESGFTFSPDSYLQKELEASFIFEDTPDQEKATLLTKSGMESPHPMDLLVCGDVGFGKTEVAIRAAFKAITDSKQVAVLVPTTILALQHYRTFKERLENFPCTIDYLSRHKRSNEQKEILKNVSEGKLDLIIGTHRLVSKDVIFKDLGLLIIDEEQKFGVGVKEKLRQLKENVDTLTLTATPIPRTLQLSLMGARDLTIINTPPPNRYPIFTELHLFNEDIIKEGIEYEISRNGQVFFIHNRVQNINEVEALINSICPNASTVVAHGQMDGKLLEKIMLKFINGDFDVLIGTAIIESGLDIPNANTIFINNAHHFGLSDLHQLRGRVGRSNKKAYCYLLAPPLTTLTPEARRRLKAIEEYSELGSGFNIAMQDLDIRGAGNLLGGEQSGFIADIGFDAYHKILDEAVMELKEEEFKDLLKTNEAGLPEEQKEERRQKAFITDCTIDTDFEVHIPEYYVNNISERIRLYRELDTLENEEALGEFKEKLSDRFGKIPPPVEALFFVVRLRWKAIKMGFEGIILKYGKMILRFISDQTSDYYRSSNFSAILKFVQNQAGLFQMKQTSDKLTLSIEKVNSIEKAYHIIDDLFKHIIIEDESGY